MRRRALPMAALVLASCGAPTPPVATVAVEPPPAATAPSGPCVDAAAQRARVKGLLAEGRLDRALRVIARADTLCPATSGESAADRAAAQEELDRDPGAGPDALYEAGVAAKRGGDAAGAQRLFDRAIVALERASRRAPGKAPERIALDAPNGVTGNLRDAAWCGVGKAGCLAVAHDNAITIYDASTWRERFTIDAGDDVYALAVSPDGRTLASASVRHIRIWDLERGAHVSELPDDGDEVRWSHDGRTLITARSREPAIDVFGTADWRKLRTITPASQPRSKGASSIDGLAASARGDVVAASFEDGSVKVWRTGSGAEIRTIRADTKRVREIAMSPDGKLVAAVGSAGVQVWNVATGKAMRPVHKGYARDVAWTPDGRALVIGTIHGLEWWDLEKGQLLGKASSGQTGKLVFDAGGARLAIVGIHQLGVWEAATNGVLPRLTMHAEAVHSAAWGPGGGMFVTGHWDDSIRIWDTAKGAPVRTLLDEDSVMAVAVSPDGKLIASGTTRPTVTLWNAETGEQVHVFPGQDGWSNAVTFGKSGKLLAWGTGKIASVADVATFAVRRTFGPLGEEVTSVALHPSEELLAVGTSGSMLHLFHLATGKETASLKIGNTVSGLAWSPDGTTLLAGENEPMLFDTTDGRLERKLGLQGHEGYVGSVAFRADGKLAASGFSDKLVLLWDPATGESSRKLEGHGDLVRSVAFRPDGKWLLSSGDDGSARLWPLDRGRAVTLRALREARDAYAFTSGPEGRVELFGDAGRRFLICRVGQVTYPFDLCQERVEVPGLLAKALAGDESYLLP